MTDYDETEDIGEQTTAKQDFNVGSIDKNRSYDADESINMADVGDINKDQVQDYDESKEMGAILDFFGKNGGFDNSLVNGYNIQDSYTGGSNNNKQKCSKSGYCELEVSDEYEFAGEFEHKDELEIADELEVDGELEHDPELEIDLDYEVKQEIENPDEIEVLGELENELEFENKDGFEVGGDLEVEDNYKSQGTSTYGGGGIPQGWGRGPSNPFGNMFGGNFGGGFKW